MNDSSSNPPQSPRQQKAGAKKSRFKFYALGLCAIIVGGLGAYFWQSYNHPLSGGPGGDNFFATRLKNQVYATHAGEDERGFVRLTPENSNGWFHIFAESVQTFSQYQRENPTRPTTQRRTIVLQPIGRQSPEQRAMMSDLKTYCQTFFGLPARIAPPLSLGTTITSRPSGYAHGQRQYDAGKILSDVLEPKLPPDAAAYLGVTMDDLYADRMGFVFGLATWHERVGVYSLLRYFPRHGAPLSDFERACALRRSCQVLSHETGHMFGITHCVFYKCAMNGSNSLADGDQTPLEYCPECRQKLAWNIGLNMTLRDSQLRAFYAQHGLSDLLLSVPPQPTSKRSSN